MGPASAADGPGPSTGPIFSFDGFPVLSSLLQSAAAREVSKCECDTLSSAQVLSVAPVS